MEELMLRLKEIDEEINGIAEVTEMIRRESNIFECFDRVNKEVV